MKINVLLQEIKNGQHDLDEKFVKLPKKMVLELFKELHRRRKVMSVPNKVMVERHLNAQRVIVD